LASGFRPAAVIRVSFFINFSPEALEAVSSVKLYV
jgi:hypothetical protein